MIFNAFSKVLQIVQTSTPGTYKPGCLEMLFASPLDHLYPRSMLFNMEIFIKRCFSKRLYALFFFYNKRNKSLLWILTCCLAAGCDEFYFSFSLDQAVWESFMLFKSCTVLLFTWMFCAGALKRLASGTRNNWIIFSWDCVKHVTRYCFGT